MNHRWTNVVGVALAVSVVAGSAPHLAAQSAAFTVDGDWAQLPGGTNWDGSTSWIETDGEDNVVVLVRTAPHFRMFTPDGRFVKAWNDGPFGSAHSLTIDPAGFYWVTDSVEHVVQKFSPDGELLLTLGRAGMAGDNTTRDRFNQPNHVAVTSNGEIYVSDGYQNARVVHFTPEGEFVRIIGGDQGSEPGQLQVPHGVAVDGDGRILVNDSDNARVSVFDRDGNFVESWPAPSRGGIVVADDGTVYVSDVNADIVNIVRNGRIVDSVEVPRAHGLAVDSNGTIYTSGASRMTVYKITPD